MDLNGLSKEYILMSIKPHYADLIYTERKRFEYRKRAPKLVDLPILLYETAPVQKVTGIIADWSMEGTAVSDIDIYAGLGGGKKRVRRDDGKIFDSIAAASMSAYGYAGSGIKRAITTGRKAKGHHWYWADEISEDSQR